MNRIQTLALSCIAFGAAAASQAADIAYDNLINPLGNYLGGFAYEEAADDITLEAGTGRVLESFSVSYAGFNFDGNETLTVTLYNMDGAPTPGSFGFDTPGSVLYSTGPVPIGETLGSTITFLGGAGTILPDTLAVGFAFGGVEFDPTGAGADAGPLLYDPAGVGSSLDDYWLRGYPNAGDGWGLYTFGGNPPINFGIQITTTVIPEAGTWMSMAGLVAVAGMVFLRQRRSTH